MRVPWLAHSLSWLRDHWKLWGIPTITATIGALVRWWYSARKERAEALKSEHELRELKDGAPLREEKRKVEARELRVQNEMRLIRAKRAGENVESEETDLAIKKEAVRRVADEMWRSKK